MVPWAVVSCNTLPLFMGALGSGIPQQTATIQAYTGQRSPSAHCHTATVQQARVSFSRPPHCSDFPGTYQMNLAHGICQRAPPPPCVHDAWIGWLWQPPIAPAPRAPRVVGELDHHRADSWPHEVLCSWPPLMGLCIACLEMGGLFGGTPQTRHVGATVMGWRWGWAHRTCPMPDNSPRGRASTA